MAKKFTTPQAPIPIHVEEDDDMRPVAVTVGGQALAGYDQRTGGG